jgi:hypothetical protein
MEAVIQGKQFVSSRLKGRNSFESAGTPVTEYSGRGEAPATPSAIVIATESHRNSLRQRLRAEGAHINASIQQGAYVSLDAAIILSTFMVNDWPDPVRFAQGFGKSIESASKAAMAKSPCVAIFGEGVGLLSAEGKRDAAIRIEQLCNELAKNYDLDIFCAYPLNSFDGDLDEPPFKIMCAEHSAVYSR